MQKLQDELEDDIDVRSNITQSKNITIKVIVGLMGILHVIGNIFIIIQRLFVEPIGWENSLYSLDYAYVFYYIHTIFFCIFMYGGIFILIYRFNTKQMFIYAALYIVAGIITILPLLGISRSKEQFGFGVYLASGIVSNFSQIFFAIALILPFKQFAFRQSTFYAFHLICGYNVVYFPYKYLLAANQTTNTIVAWIILLMHFCFAFLFIKIFPSGPLREKNFQVDTKTIFIIAAIVIPSIAVPISYFVTCINCGKD